MASKNAKRDAKKFMDSPLGAVILIIAAIVAFVKLVIG